MRVILDTNVFISGVFFAGTPYKVLDAWRKGRIRLVVSPEILTEYRRIGADLSRQFPGVDLSPFMELLAANAELVTAEALPMQVCTDATDDLFLACARTANVKIICSGDKALLKTSGFGGIRVMTPRQFLVEYLK